MLISATLPDWAKERQLVYFWQPLAPKNKSGVIRYRRGSRRPPPP